MTPIDTHVSLLSGRGPGSDSSTIPLTFRPFDQRHYLNLIRARGETIRRVMAELKPILNPETALDAGCGVGFFAQILHDQGLDAHGFDGRLENVIEARKRFPKIPFAEWDVEDPEIARLGEFDLVLCFGLLYHLETRCWRSGIFAC
jgi:2-polyprenyl-3-methyl-5-hydroxy-6-metoxy-1,4-benzoquinol methylase